MKDIITKEHVFKHPIGEVWKAISEAEEISTWFIKADFKAEVGYKYTFTHDSSNITGEVLQAEPVHTLIYTWVVGGTDAITTVKWKLTETDNGTHLMLEHSGISNYPGETAVTMFDKFNGGWSNCITNLEKYLKTNINV